MNFLSPIDAPVLTILVPRASLNERLEAIRPAKSIPTTQRSETLAPGLAALRGSQEIVRYDRNALTVTSGVNDGLSYMSVPSIGSDDKKPKQHSPSGPPVNREKYDEVGSIWLGSSVPNDQRTHRHHLSLPQSDGAVSSLPGVFPYFPRNDHQERFSQTFEPLPRTSRIRNSSEHNKFHMSSAVSLQMIDSSFVPLQDRSHIMSARQNMGGSSKNQIPRRRSSARDEFGGEVQYLDDPSSEEILNREGDLPSLPFNLDVKEQDCIFHAVEKQLSQCAFYFIARYKFPIPLLPDKRPVRYPEDRAWNEWVFLLKRLATKRRIPARLLYNGQIKQFVTVLESSMEMRHAAKHSSRPCKDDRNILQLISAGIQVAKILKDASAMEYLDSLYKSTEFTIQRRRNSDLVSATGGKGMKETVSSERPP